MTSQPEPTPLAPDCEALRTDLIANPLAPIWQLDAAAARALHIQLTVDARAGWLPPLADLPVSSQDLPGGNRVPAMRRYRCDVPDPSVCLLWFHGGGWVLGNLETTEATARTACAATGWEVLSVDYRCAPLDPFPAAIDDALAAADWALEHHPRVVVGGDSAGGNLAAAVAQQRGGHPGLVGQVLVYPTTDPTLGYPSASQFVDGPFLTRRDVEWFYDQYVPTAADRASALVDLVSDFDSRAIVPTPAVVLTVGHDPLRDEGIAYARMLADTGAQVSWIHAPELFHGAFSQAGFLPSAAARVAEVWSTAHRVFA